MTVLSLLRERRGRQVVKGHHGRFAENALRTVWIFFGHIKDRGAVLRAMTAWAAKMDIRNHMILQ
jgi:hypothetical protein